MAKQKCPMCSCSEVLVQIDNCEDGKKECTCEECGCKFDESQKN